MRPITSFLVGGPRLRTVGKTTLNNAYDHFVFAKKGDLEGCDTETAKAFNFTDMKEFPEGLEIIKNLDIEKFKAELAADIKFKGKKIVPRYSEGKVRFLGIGFQTKLLDGWQKGQLLPWNQMISDHLPIMMTCKTKDIK